jgi:hypothetical protein
MLENVKSIVRGSYFQLLALFVLVVFLVSLGVLPDWRVDLVFFAVILGAFGWTLTTKQAELRLPVWLVWTAFLVAIILRVLPFFFSSVPLGYDLGWHKYPFEHPFTDEWTKSVFPLPFLLLASGLTAVFGSWFVLVPLFIALSAATAFALYYAGKKAFNRDVGILAAVLFAVSIAQFETYALNYYKNVLGIIVLLLALLLVPDNKRWNWKLVLVGALVMGFHQPAFFIFGLTYLLYVLLDIKAWKTTAFRWSVVNGAAILALALLINFDRVYEIFFQQLGWAVTAAPGGGGGTFFNSYRYVLYTLPFVPFAVTGFVKTWRKHVPIAIATGVATIVVVFELFFHNRFLIYLDVFVILYAAVGMFVLVAEKPRIGRWVVGVFLVLALVLASLHAWQARPLISDAELAEIQSLNELEPSAWIMVTDKYYSPWLKGYVARPIVAPGLFDEDTMDRSEWEAFWTGIDREVYISRYPSPLYIHVGGRQPQYDFSEVCTAFPHETMKLYRCA